MRIGSCEDGGWRCSWLEGATAMEARGRRNVPDYSPLFPTTGTPGLRISRGTFALIRNPNTGPMRPNRSPSLPSNGHPGLPSLAAPAAIQVGRHSHPGSGTRGSGSELLLRIPKQCSGRLAGVMTRLAISLTRCDSGTRAGIQCCICSI